RLKGKAQRIFFMDLAHGSPPPILVQRGGRVLMVFHPTGEIAARSEAFATGENSLQAGASPPSEVRPEIIGGAIEVSDEGKRQRVTYARQSVADVNVINSLVFENYEPRKVNLRELLEWHQGI